MKQKKSILKTIAVIIAVEICLGLIYKAELSETFNYPQSEISIERSEKNKKSLIENIGVIGLVFIFISSCVVISEKK